MWNARTIITRLVLWSLVGVAFLQQAAGLFVNLWAERAGLTIYPDPGLNYSIPLRTFMPVWELTVAIAPVAIPAAVLTVKRLRRGRYRSEVMLLTSALAAGVGACVEFLITPLMLFWSLEAIPKPWWLQDLVVIGTNGFLQGCVVSMLMASAHKGGPEGH